MLSASRLVARSSARLSRRALLRLSDSLATCARVRQSTLSAGMASVHILPLETPVLTLPCEVAFSGLTDQEKRYAHHLSRSSWWGSLVVLCQTSPESADIFCLLTKMFRNQPIDSLRDQCISKNILVEEEFQSLMVYYAGLMYNTGNYIGFGDRKFIPSISVDKLKALMKISKSFLEHPEEMTFFFDRAAANMYDLSESKKYLGFAPKGVTMYFSPNCTEEDSDLCKKYMTARNIEAWNTRLIKHEDGDKVCYDIRIASIEKDTKEGITIEKDEFEGNTFKVTRGDYSEIMKKIVEELALAKPHAANKIEDEMLEKYIESFTTGSVQAHKEGSTHWVKNKSPSIELYTGFIEVYRDPSQQRAEFESFVAMVNREQSKRFDRLVDQAEKDIIPLLPWGKDFEEDTFMRPGFSSLDVLTYAASGLPIGINIPNYKDVAEEQGFKNVSLTNVLSARSGDKVTNFVSAENHALKEKHSSNSLELCVGLHELLGHGSGKFLRKKADGKLNFDPETVKNPFTGEAATFYDVGEKYETKFTDMGSAYEECRAEAVAMHLCLYDEVLEIFGIADADKEDIKYTLWFDMFLSGIKGLEMYQMEQGKWGQAHSQARYVILQVALQEGGGVVQVVETVGSDGQPDLLLSVDRSKIATTGRKVMADFLKKLQVYRSLGDAESAREMFSKYSLVPMDGSHPFGAWHKIVTARRRPRVVLTMANTVRNGDDVSITTYPKGAQANVTSWVERYSTPEFDLITKILPEYIDSRYAPRVYKKE